VYIDIGWVCGEVGVRWIIEQANRKCWRKVPWMGPREGNV